MANDWVTDHKWHDVSYHDLPDWVKRRVRELDRHPLGGKSFEYRREPITGRYQRRLRRHPSGAMMWAKRTTGWFKRNVGKIFILAVVLAIITIVLSAVGLSISGTVSLVAGIVICLVGLGILLWSLRTLSQRRPRLANMIMVLLISLMFVMFSSAYLDVRSLQDVRNSIFSAFSTEQGEFRSRVDMLVQRAELKVIDVSSETKEAIEQTVEDVSSTEHVYLDGGILVGASGHYITLRNNPDATDTSWEEIKAFLLADQTDNRQYDFDTFVCADFAEMLHNNAEAAGLRAAFVAIELGPCSYYPMSGGHALNAFKTTDRGLIFIDCTSSNQGVNSDKIVDIEVGKEYVPRSIFPEPGWSDVWDSMGTVERIEIIQW
jgi:hypothetical protein